MPGQHAASASDKLAVVRPAWADPISHRPLIDCCLMPIEPLDVDYRSCVQITAFSL